MAKKSFTKSRTTSFDVNKLKAKYDKINRKGSGKSDFEDDRFWTLTVDKAQVGKATIRFLPSVIKSEDDLPYIEKFFHYVNGPGGKLWEICPNVIGKECPICKMNSELYNSGNEADKKIASSRKKQKKYIANIYVVDDEGNPDNNGKVFLFEFGTDILNRIHAQLDVEVPEDEDEIALPQVIPFMVDASGADFILESHKEDDYRKYSKSRYKKPKALAVDDIDAILEQQHDLNDYFDTEIVAKVKSYEELEDKLNKVLKKRSVNSSVEADMSDEAEDDEVEVSVDEDEGEVSIDVDDTDISDEIDKLLNG